MIKAVNDSVDMLADEVAGGRSIYGIFPVLGSEWCNTGLQKRSQTVTEPIGVNTGFGGSADVRTGATGALQTALLQMQLSGVLPTHSDSSHSSYATLAMPGSWVRGTILIRCNSLLRGHSGIRFSVSELLSTLLQKDLIPLIPLRGSVSASGDLSPLSYIAGTLEGNPDVRVWAGRAGARSLMPADKALSLIGMDAVQFGPKEVLAMINGTAVSASVVALALHEANHFVVLSQILTAMTTEALLGCAGNYDPFISAARPHSGQTEVAENIRRFLRASKFARLDGDERVEKHQLAQDRYATRTSPQWLGPLVEDLLLAQTQVNVELNSTTDNPLTNLAAGTIHNSGNFQAASLTSATEKTRYALQMTGRMVFAQSSELLDVSLNNGLPPNLSPDEPSTSFVTKGLDINMASYMAELGFLANPVSSHVQPAEMNNQGINSLALVSARQTHLSLDVLGLMLATHTWSVCQALDLRAMHRLFMADLLPALYSISREVFADSIESSLLDSLHHKAVEAIQSAIAHTVKMDSSTRFGSVAKAAIPVWVSGIIIIPKPSSSDPLTLIRLWTSKVAAATREIFTSRRQMYFDSPDAMPWLGSAGKILYAFVRNELHVPFCRGLVDHPTVVESCDNNKINNNDNASRSFPADQAGKKTIGSQVSVLYAALREGRFAEVISRCLREASLNAFR